MKLYKFIILFLFLSACSTIALPTTPVTPSATHLPSRTPIPSPSPTITRTPTITLTPTISQTPTITLTPTVSPTFTRSPSPQPTLPSGLVSCIPTDTPRQAGIVVGIVDGDTIDVRLEIGKTYRIRYIGMDTPEKGRPYFELATAKNNQLVAWKKVSLVKDISETDRYGRLLRYIIVDNIFVNLELVRLGFAQVLTYPPDVACSSVFLQAEQEARSRQIGLWKPSSTPSIVNEEGGGPAPCNCSIDYDCKDFATHAQAQTCFDFCGGSPSYNWSRLDADHDGKACESLP